MNLTRTAIKKMFWIFIASFFCVFQVNAKDCDEVDRLISEYVNKNIVIENIYRSGECNKNCANLARKVSELFGIDVYDPNFYVTVIKHKNTDVFDLIGPTSLSSKTQYLYPKNTHLNKPDEKENSVKWKYHVILVYGDKIIDLDIKDSDRMVEGRKYLNSVLKPKNSVEDFKVERLNRWDDFEVYKIPVSDYIDERKFNDAGLIPAFSYPKQSLMDFYASFFKE